MERITKSSVELATDYAYLADLPQHLLNKVKKIRKNATKQSLITRSLYDGIWLDSLQCMDAHGVYTFPDGSVYTGYVQMGHFHGYGTLHLAAPYNFTFKGTFIKGVLDEIEEMWFDDGLCVKAAIDGYNMNFSGWKYCTKDDRRYAEEQREGIQPVGPFSRLTPHYAPRELPKNHYDVEEGIYNPANSLITHRPLPFPHFNFVACKKDVDWIIENCRQGLSTTRDKVKPEVCHKIIRNNLDSELEVAEHVPTCNHDQDKNRKRYFARLCPDQKKGIEDSEDSIGNRLRDSSSTCSSFSATSMNIDVEEVLFLAHEYDEYNLGRDLGQEASTMIKTYVWRKKI